MTWLLAGLPLTLLALGFPVFLVLLVSVIVALALVLDVPMVAIHQIMIGSVSNFALVAVPFFFFAGELMARSGISASLVAWVQSIIGGIRGSIALTTVGACTIFGTISGSSPATVGAIGSTRRWSRPPSHQPPTTRCCR